MNHRNSNRNIKALLACLAGSAACLMPTSIAQAQDVVDHFQNFDLNGDGVTNQADMQAYQTLVDQHDIRADLDLNGSINAADMRLAERSVAHGGDAGPFQFHWSVRELWHQPDLGDAPILRDTQLFPQFDFGKYPDEGYQQMMISPNGNITRWRRNYDDWMNAHLEKIEADLIEAQQTNPGFRYGAIDYEAAMPVWSCIQRYNSRQYSTWRAFVAALHRDEFDQQFLNRVGFTTPAGATRWRDLDARGRVDLCEASWNHFGQDFYNRTLAKCREIAPDVKWGMFNMPKFATGIRIWNERREINNDFGWLLEQLDFYAPSFYRAPFVTTESAPIQSQDPLKLIQWYRSNVEELERLRDRFNPDAEIFGFVFAHYHPSTAAGRTMPDATLTDENLRAALMYSRLFGTDGLMIWHPLPRVPNPDKPWMNAEQLGLEMSQRWSPLMHDWQSGLVDSGSDDDNSSHTADNLDDGPSKMNDGKTMRTAGVSTISGGRD